MKINILILIFFQLYFCTIGISQRDANWLLEGWDRNLILNFKDSLKIDTLIYKKIDLDYSNANISDLSGKLIIVTNGCRVFNTDLNIMKNGHRLNGGNLSCRNIDTTSINEVAGFESQQIVPSGYDNNIYYLISNARNVHRYLPISLDYKLLLDSSYYSIIDMRGDNGKGEVIKRNILFNTRNKMFPEVKLLQHGNGRDWWYINVDSFTGCFIKYLITKDTVVPISDQCITDFRIERYSFACINFSPDGKKLVVSRSVVINKKVTPFFDIFDFDRCTGNLSNKYTFQYSSDSLEYNFFDFSPNSRFLYSAVDVFKLYQYDLESSDISKSGVLIDTVHYREPLPKGGYFGYPTRPKIAPNGKMYIGTTGSCSYLGVINNPNEKGKLCNGDLLGLELPQYNNSKFLVNHPNYNLGRAIGSSCDTVSTSTEAIIFDKAIITIYPNPAKEEITINNGTNANQIVIYDGIGRSVFKSTIVSNNITQMSINNLQNGLYFYTLLQDSVMVYSGKIVVQK